MSRDFQGNMRPGQKNRGRGGRNNNMMGGGGNPNNNNNRPRPPHRMQNFDSSGPSVKIRGNAYQVFERYIAMAREASSAGDRVAAENLYQHAEHYYRIMQANGDGQNNQMGQGRPMTPADNEMNMGGGDMDGDGQMPQQPQPAQPHNPQQHQPQQHNPQHNPQHYQQQPRQGSQPYQQPQPQHQPPVQSQPQPQPHQPPVQSQPQPQPEPQPPAPGSDTPHGS
jgi:Domain of unknown function (DUF4167)